MGQRALARKPLIGGLFDTFDMKRVLNLVPSLGRHMTTLKEALKFTFDWRREEVYTATVKAGSKRSRISADDPEVRRTFALSLSRARACSLLLLPPPPPPHTHTHTHTLTSLTHLLTGPHHSRDHCSILSPKVGASACTCVL